MKINIICKNIAISLLGFSLTGCSCGLFSKSAGCTAAMVTGLIVTAPVLVPYYGAKKLVDDQKQQKTDRDLIRDVTLGDDRDSLEKVVLGQISYHTSVEKRVEMDRLAARKLIQYDVPHSQNWTESGLTAMILAYHNQAYRYVNEEKFDQYSIRAWELYLQHRQANYSYYRGSHAFLDVMENYYLVKHQLLKANSAPEKALPIFKQCLQDPMWSMAEANSDGNEGYLPCKYALKYYNRKFFKYDNANQEIYDEIEKQYKENLEKRHQQLKREGVIA